MIEPEQQRRYERQIAGMLREAGSDDPETFGIIAGMLTDAAKAGVRDAAQRLRAGGYTYGDLARVMGIDPSTARERFGVERRSRPGRYSRPTS